MAGGSHCSRPGMHANAEKSAKLEEAIAAEQACCAEERASLEETFAAEQRN